MPKFNVLSPIKLDDEIHTSGEIELSARHAADAVARGELEPVRESKAEKAAADKAAAGGAK